METIQGCPPACCGAGTAVPMQFQGESARMACLNVCEDRSVDINIVTAEGDTVTLGSDSHSEATLLTYEHLVYSNSGYTTEEGRLVDFNTERTVSVSVEGDLNDEELADIQALLSDLGRMLKAFLTGKTEGDVEEDSVDLSRYGSLCAFEADFEVHARLQAIDIEADRLALEPARRPQPPESMIASRAAFAAAPASAESAQPESPAAAAAVSPADRPPAPAAFTETASPAEAADTDTAARWLARRVKESGLRPRRFVKLIKKYLQTLMKEMRMHDGLDDRQMRRGESILDKCFGLIEKPSSGSELTSDEVSLKLQWVSLQYELKAEEPMQAGVEETA